MKTLSIEAKVENLPDLVGFVESELKTLHLPRPLCMQVLLAVEEIFVNISKYAYELGTGIVNIKVLLAKQVVIQFEDTGISYNPLKKPDPDVTGPIEERAAGGLGFFMVKNIMDEVKYERYDNKNILTIKKVIG